MKTVKIVIVTVAAAVLLTSCEGLEWGRGELRLGFVDGDYVSTKAAYALPDTSDFILEVTGSTGKSIYKGPYGDSPEGILLASGTYTVKVLSEEFKGPAFDRPQYGDEQVVKVASGKVVKVNLICSQLNCGIVLKTGSSFLTAYPNGLLYVKSSEGRLLYAYRETRIAYFSPGAVSVVLSNNGVEETLMTRNLLSQQILTVNITASTTQTSAPTGKNISIQVDTSRTWLSESCKIGSDSSKGSGTDNAYNVNTARDNIDAEDVWVYGYIVGGDMTSGVEGISYETPFTSRTNIAIGPRSSVLSKQSCMSVFLPSGTVRDALNLVDNPHNLGKQVYLKGDIVESYFGIPGLKNITEYQFK